MRTSIAYLYLFLLTWAIDLALALSFESAQQYSTLVDISEASPRNVAPLQEWANQAGIQTIQGVQVTQSPLGHNNPDGQDYTLMTTQDIAAQTPILYVPAQVTLSSTDTVDQLGGNLQAAENALERADRLPLFRLVVKILSEYEKGLDSPWSPWLDALPRRFNNGVAMTDACFGCLPPYASYLAAQERSTFDIFYDALQERYLELTEETLDNRPLLQWAYNVALTRHQITHNAATGDLEKNIAPMADMINHASFPNCLIQYDDQGNCVVTTTTDVPADSLLTVSHGDPNDPSPLFAKYGFLVDDCPTIFCKAIHLKNEMETLGYVPTQLLVDTVEGEIAPAVWDLFLYRLLLQSGDEDLTNGFYTAVTTNDQETKDSYHNQYFPYTVESLQQFVNEMLTTVNHQTTKAFSYDILTHPRVPIIVEHNNLVRDTFLKVKANLDRMAAVPKEQ